MTKQSTEMNTTISKLQMIQLTIFLELSLKTLIKKKGNLVNPISLRDGKIF